MQETGLRATIETIRAGIEKEQATAKEAEAKYLQAFDLHCKCLRDAWKQAENKAQTLEKLLAECYTMLWKLEE